jgi:hypothetical protein
MTTAILPGELHDEGPHLGTGELRKVSRGSALVCPKARLHSGIFRPVALRFGRTGRKSGDRAALSQRLPMLLRPAAEMTCT